MVSTHWRAFPPRWESRVAICSRLDAGFSKVEGENREKTLQCKIRKIHKPMLGGERGDGSAVKDKDKEDKDKEEPGLFPGVHPLAQSAPGAAG